MKFPSKFTEYSRKHTNVPNSFQIISILPSILQFHNISLLFWLTHLNCVYIPHLSDATHLTQITTLEFMTLTRFGKEYIQIVKTSYFLKH
jgi:hypothetical protein